MGPRNHVLDGGREPHGKSQFQWEKGRPVVNYRDALLWAVQKWLNQLKYRFGYGLRLLKEPSLRWGPHRPIQRAIFRGNDMPEYARWHCHEFAKWRNQSRCRFFGLWTWVSQRKHVLGGLHTGATWRILLNRPCAAVMRPFCHIALTSCFINFVNKCFYNILCIKIILVWFTCVVL